MLQTGTFWKMLQPSCWNVLNRSILWIFGRVTRHEGEVVYTSYFTLIGHWLWQRS